MSRYQKLKRHLIIIPASKQEDGYTFEELDAFMSKEEQEGFKGWITGQTCGMDTKTNKPVFYTWDVTRFLQWKRFGDKPEWD